MHELTGRIFIACVIAVSLSTPAAQTRWLKGNLHTHTLWSDGNGFPEMVAAWYRARGYHFLALSDHNILSDGEGWAPLSLIERRGGAEALQQYLDRFGEDWVERREGREGDEGGDGPEVRVKTLDETRSLLERPDQFLLIAAEEITDDHEGHPVHLNATNLREVISPQGGSSIRDVMRRNLTVIEEQSQRLNVPILGHINHPNYGWAITAEDLAHVLEDHFFEVFNGHPSTNSFGARDRPSAEHMWDIANTIRLAELNAPPLFGLATDDSHNYHSPAGSIPGRGWVMVQSDSLDAASIIKAMKAGDFYASTGVTLKDVRFDNAHQTLSVQIDPAGDATYVTRFIGTRRDAGDDAIGEVLAEVSGLRASYTLAGDELYVRAVVRSSREVEFPLVEGQMRQAWTQPVGFKTENRNAENRNMKKGD